MPGLVEEIKHNPLPVLVLGGGALVLVFGLMSSKSGGTTPVDYVNIPDNSGNDFFPNPTPAPLPTPVLPGPCNPLTDQYCPDPAPSPLPVPVPLPPPNPPGQDDCPPGYHRPCPGILCECVPDSQPNPPPHVPCLPGFHWDETHHTCLKDDSQCPEGYHWNMVLKRCERNEGPPGGDGVVSPGPGSLLDSMPVYASANDAIGGPTLSPLEQFRQGVRNVRETRMFNMRIRVPQRPNTTRWEGNPCTGPLAYMDPNCQKQQAPSPDSQSALDHVRGMMING